MTAKKKEEAPVASEFAAKKADGIATRLTGAGFGIDPVTVVTILVALLQMFKACNLSPGQAYQRVVRPGPLGLIALRRVIRKHVDKDEAEVVEAAFLEAASETSVEEIEKLLTEV